MRRTYKLRAYPTRPQEGRAARLKEIRAADPHGQGRHSFTAQQQTLRRLNVVFGAYFRRVKGAEKGRRLKPRQRFDQVLFIAGDGAKWEPADWGRWAHATFQAVGRVKVHQHRRVADMTASASGTIEYPGRNVVAKAGLNRSILDAGWTQFTSILVAKAESAGRRVLLVNPAPTSIDGYACGAMCTRPRQDTVVCPIHGELDADLNGARNIATRAGLGSGQASAA